MPILNKNYDAIDIMRQMREKEPSYVFMGEKAYNILMNSFSQTLIEEEDREHPIEGGYTGIFYGTPICLVQTLPEDYIIFGEL